MLLFRIFLNSYSLFFLMINIKNQYFLILIILLSIFSIFYSSFVQATELDLSAAQDAVGKRFASKFCEAKKEGFSLDASSEFALNNTYLKFAAFPDQDKFVDNLWQFTLERVRNECGQYITKTEEITLRDFFEEEGAIAINRDLYLPN